MHYESERYWDAANGLTVSNSLWKYVDDTTLAEVIPRGGDSNIQSAVDDIQN